MSLVGSLEDLGLGEILQIISLSRKSGTLRVRSSQGEGHILFRDGEIRGAALRGQPGDLAELLVGRQELPEEEVERLLAHGREQGETFEELLIHHGVLSVERLDAIRLDCVEAAVLSMFRWPSGEFSFEVQAGPPPEPHPGGLTLSQGINPQFLALEGARLQDEAGSAPEKPDAEPAVVCTEGGGEPGRLALDDVRPAPAREPAPPLGRPEIAVLIEPELPRLEVAKRWLADSFARVHAFQRPDLGIARIRQYLGRGVLPLVLLSERTPPDSLTGARDWRQILTGLKALAPRMPVLLLAEGGRQAGTDSALDGVLSRPGPGSSDLRAELDALLPPGVPDPNAGSLEEPLSEQERARVAQALDQLRHPGAGAEVLRLVLRFASAQFSRVAMFMLRDDLAVGMAQSGLAAAGGPDDPGLRQLELPVRQPAWFRRVIESGEPTCAPPLDEGDHMLAVLLGNALPAEAYVGPIRSRGRVVALVYADRLPREDAIGDVRALGEVLRAAGVALDRARRERAA